MEKLNHLKLLVALSIVVACVAVGLAGLATLLFGPLIVAASAGPVSRVLLIVAWGVGAGFLLFRHEMIAPTSAGIVYAVLAVAAGMFALMSIPVGVAVVMAMGIAKGLAQWGRPRRLIATTWLGKRTA